MSDLHNTERFDDQPGEPFDDQFVESPLDEDASPVCPHCIEPVGRFDHFCPHCGGPVTAHASIDPLGQVFAAGRAYQNATGVASSSSDSTEGDGITSAPSPRPRGIIVLGMWLIFGPQIVLMLFALVFTLREVLEGDAVPANLIGAPDTDFTMSNLLGILAALAMLILYIAILWKVTLRWRDASEPRAF